MRLEIGPVLQSVMTPERNSYTPGEALPHSLRNTTSSMMRCPVVEMNDTMT